MVNVELIYDKDCPNVEETSGRLAGSRRLHFGFLL
jgi:hypothetical protein